MGADEDHRAALRYLHSAQVQDAELLGMVDADLRARLERFALEALLEVADPLVELTRVVGERLDLRAKVTGDVVNVVRLVRPAEPDVDDLLDLKALPQMLGEEVRVPAAGEHRVQRDPSGGPVVRVVVVPILEEDGRRIDGYDRL